MGKKYIIELLDDCPSEFKGIIVFGLTPEGQISAEPIPVEDLTPYTEPDLERIRKEAYENGYENGFIAGHLKAEKSGQSFYEDGYQCGLNDAWEAARKIRDMTWKEQREIFGTDIYTDIIALSASECIEKIRQYEQEKEEIKVGDEVEMKCGVRPAIYMQGTNGSDEIYLLFNDGSCGIHGRDEIECKTGRHFPEIAEVLAKMKKS